MVKKLLMISFAGACGTATRFFICEAASKAKNGLFSNGTLLVNVIGSLVFGLLYGLVQKRFNVSEEVRIAMLVGFIGAFTTFSALAFETAKMLKSGNWLLAVGNVSIQMVLGIAAIVVGFLAGRLL